ncbi:trace amine-associated receptor 13c-like [Diretmus argenteus]
MTLLVNGHSTGGGMTLLVNGHSTGGAMTMLVDLRSTGGGEKMTTVLVNWRSTGVGGATLLVNGNLHTPTNFLLLSLAVSDFLVGLLVMPGEILFIGDCWFLGNITSLILKDYLKQPDRYNSCDGECVIFINYTTGSVDLVVSFIGPVTVIIVLYSRVFVVAVSQARAMRSHIVTVTHRRSVTVTVKNSEMKAARTLGIVIVVFLVCYCPHYLPSLAGQDTSSEASYLIFVLLLLYCNSLLNPVIYAFFYPWFRKAMKLIVTLNILQSDSSEAKIL